MQKPSRQALRTQKLLQEALIELIAERGFATLRVQEITERANVGRATFYMHYKDKDELLATVVDKLYREVAEMLGHADEMMGWQRTLEQARRQPELYWVALNHGPTATRIQQLMVTQITSQLQALGHVPSERLEMMTHFMAGALMGLLRWWLDHGETASVETVTTFARQTIAQGLSASVNNES